MKKGNLSNTINTLVYPSLTASLKKDWQELWENSSYANIANSPEWFRAADQAFKYKKKAIITIRAGETGELVGIFPLVQIHLYGLPVLAPPAMVHADRVSPLIDDRYASGAVFGKLAESLASLGNVYLSALASKIVEKFSASGKIFKSFGAVKSGHINLSEKPLGDLSNAWKNNLLHKEKLAPEPVALSLSLDNHTQALAEVFNIDILSAKHQKGRGIFWSDEIREFYSLLAKNNPEHFFIALLCSGEKPISYILGFRCHGVYTTNVKAYLPEYGNIRPGAINLLRLLEAIDKEKYNEIDFGLGYDRFKRDFTKTVRILNNAVVSNNFLVRLYIKLAYGLVETAYAFMEKYPNLYVLLKRFRDGMPKIS